MSPLVYVVMFGLIPLSIYLGGCHLSEQLLSVFITAWLFLPQVEFTQLPSLDYTKMSATCFNVLLAAILYQTLQFV